MKKKDKVSSLEIENKNSHSIDKNKTYSLAIFLVLNAVVSFRSIPRILQIFNLNSPLQINQIPHFTSIINWNNLLGLSMLNDVKTISNPWIAIIDHSIDIGIKKVLVVLRVRLDIFNQREGAITLKDCECIGLKVSTKINGETISEDLKEIFLASGTPTIIIKDRDYTLSKGVRLVIESLKTKIEIVDDITHEVANALKKQFEKTKSYQLFMKLLRAGATKLRQTDLAFLIPPKLRKKGRFQAIGKLTTWGKKMFDIGILSVIGRAKKGSLLQKLRDAFPGMNALKPFILNFEKTTNKTSKVMKILKTKGLDETTNNECKKLLSTLPKNSKTKKIILLWLEKHFKIQQNLSTTYPLPVSSDIIESLFGKFKYRLERSPQADMGLSVLTIPTFCGTLDEEKIMRYIKKVTYKDMKKWENENIPYTMRKKRQEIFKENSQKAEIESSL